MNAVHSNAYRRTLAERLKLYAVTDRTWLGGRTLAEDVEEALFGGVTTLQLREKEAPDEAFLTEARVLQKLCRKHDVPHS